MDFHVGVSARVWQTRCEIMLPISEAEIFCFICSDSLCGSFIIPASLFAPEQARKTNTHLTPAEKLTTGKKSPSVLKFSNMPWTGWPLILNEMLGAPRSRQQLTTSSDVKMCWFRDATARGTRPRRGTRTCTAESAQCLHRPSIDLFYSLPSPDQR